VVIREGTLGSLTLELFEQLNLPDDVRYKIYRGNAERLFGLPATPFA